MIIAPHPKIYRMTVDEKHEFIKFVTGWTYRKPNSTRRPPQFSWNHQYAPDISDAVIKFEKMQVLEWICPHYERRIRSFILTPKGNRILDTYWKNREILDKL